MVKSLFDLCLAAVCQHQLNDYLCYMPGRCKQGLLEFFASHDQLRLSDCIRLVTMPRFGINLSKLYFYMCEDLNDEILCALTQFNKNLEQISIIECKNVTDIGIQHVTESQTKLKKLVLRLMNSLTSQALVNVKGDRLFSVDLSCCLKITSDGIFNLVFTNPSIRCLYLNHCKSLDDQALYDIAHCLGENLNVLELDYLRNLDDPINSIGNLSQLCPNIRQLSLIKMFDFGQEDPEVPTELKICGENLKDIDLCGNYFFQLPKLPPTIHTIRISVCGDEDVNDLINRLSDQPFLSSIHLQISCLEENNHAVEQANTFLCTFLPFLGSKITKLHIALPRLVDTAFSLIASCVPNLSHLSLDVKHISNYLLQRYFTGGPKAPGHRLKSLRLCRVRISYRALFAIARGAKSLVELETSHMSSVDDRFLSLLAENCRHLKNVNFNGCKWVSDKGMAAVAKRCRLKEVRIRATACTDKSVYSLAQYCPEMEWISHADFSGRPKFTDEALQHLRNSCIRRVIC
ncbi:hypothetical protein L596_012007 [Steinernema carpocapsae]|uniref:F-box/LRR-repeat protein 15-like leucin rich repeat domain-containing protein n=2 Tax=Steinernema carpocapsae TaxID=34508 RepID=A0A4U5NVT3_STECR|nr:hypothetical protein L596_012007 [Steinernema carpocapsae]